MHRVSQARMDVVIRLIQTYHSGPRGRAFLSPLTHVSEARPVRQIDSQLCLTSGRLTLEVRAPGPHSTPITVLKADTIDIPLQVRKTLGR